MNEGASEHRLDDSRGEEDTRDLDALLEFVNVGQGDATVVLDLVGRRALIVDCPSWGVARVRDVLRRYNIGVIDALFVTHFDDDHFSGIPQLADEYNPRVLYANPETLLPDDLSFPKYRAALAAFVDMQERGLSELQPGTRDTIGSVGPINWQILAPTTPDVWKAIGLPRPRRNIASAVIAIQVGPVRTIIGGDAPLRTWTKIANERLHLLHADVFRLSHHGANMRPGSKTIDTSTLLSYVGASHAVVSVGSGNRYCHPGLDTIHTFRGAGARVMCTEVSPACLGHTERVDRIAAANGSTDLGLPKVCAGNIRVEVTADSWTVYPSLYEHARVVDNWATPHCRTGCVPAQRKLLS